MSASEWDSILGRDERIIWQGQPRAGIIFRPSDIVGTLFGLFAMGFSIFWMGMASDASRGASGLSQFGWMFGLPFFAAGAYGAVGRYFWDAHRRKHTFYSLSTERAFIATDVPLIGRRLEDYPIKADTKIHRGDHSSVYFSEQLVRTNNGSETIKIGFQRLDDPNEAMRALTKVRQSKREMQAH